MILNLIFLFFTVAIIGYLVLIYPIGNENKLRNLLAFGGAYLFSLTILHLLPEVFSNNEENYTVAIFILIGFFLQLILDQFSQGVEHGHIHLHFEIKSFFSRPVFLLLSLCIHAFLEGTILIHPGEYGQHHHTSPLLVGILLHKIPATVALVSVLRSHFKSRNHVLIYLILFALASPIGLLASKYLQEYQIISNPGNIYLMAIVGGNFLHISTTIFFESNPEHSIKFRKIVLAMAGALTAALVQALL